jgi:catechol 2,3-dioxygenase-like lactoylglutathione lyase family enzyme
VNREQEAMKLNHINLTVTDVNAASEFLVRYFGMRSMGGNAGMGFLTDDDESWGFVLTLMKAGKSAQVKYPGNFHIGFFVDSAETVDRINQRLRMDGYNVALPENSGHAYGFYVDAPGGFTVEIGA